LQLKINFSSFLFDNTTSYVHCFSCFIVCFTSFFIANSVLSPSAIMPSISSNSYINKKRQSNAWKAAAVVARHRQPDEQSALQVHRDSSAQSSSFARFFSSRMMLQEHDFNMNVISKRRRERSSRESTQSMSSAKQRKIAQQMKFARQNHEDNSDICKLQNRWEKIRQRYQRYCERATRLNCTSLSSLLITSKKLHSTLCWNRA